MKATKLSSGLLAMCFLLSLALLACKSDKKTTATHDGGTADSGAKADSGAGAPKKDGGSKDAGLITAAECKLKATGASTTCTTCTCAKDPVAASTCDASCWAFAGCIARACAADKACAVKESTGKCKAEGLVKDALAHATSALTAVGACSTECAKELGLVPPHADGGTPHPDAGTHADAGH